MSGFFYLGTNYFYSALLRSWGKAEKQVNISMKLILLLGLTLCGYAVKAQNKNQETGKVDSLMAVQIAQKAWLKKFGNRVDLSKPYYAILKNDLMWVVKGTLHTSFNRGGTPYALIDRRTGRVLLNTHTK